MTRTEKTLALLVLILAVALPFAAQRAFHIGYVTAKEIWVFGR